MRPTLLTEACLYVSLLATVLNLLAYFTNTRPLGALALFNAFALGASLMIMFRGGKVEP